MFLAGSLCGDTQTETEDIISDVAETVIEKFGKGARSGFHSIAHTAALLERTLPLVAELAIYTPRYKSLVWEFL